MKSFVVTILVIIANASSSIVQGRLTSRVANNDVANDNGKKRRDLSTPALTFQGQNGLPASAYPLGLCQGSCSGDYDCATNLQCYQTTTSSSSVPGCQGTPKAGVGYCVSSSTVISVPTAPASAPTAPTLSSSSLRRFRLRLYWQKGYTWGDGITSEQRWCMQCAHTPCQKHDILQLELCSSASAVFRFLSPTSMNNAVQIKIVGTSFCLDKTGHRAIQAEICRSGKYTQQLWYDGGTNVVGTNAKFELQPVGFSTLCITADGKKGDPVYTENCVAKRMINVTNWTPF